MAVKVLVEVDVSIARVEDVVKKEAIDREEPLNCIPIQERRDVRPYLEREFRGRLRLNLAIARKSL